MAVYVDRMQTQYRGMKMCHMLADSLDELHAMAERIGLRPDWFQGRPIAHYDVCKSKRAEAIRVGAIAISFRDMANLINRLRS